MYENTPPQATEAPRTGRIIVLAVMISLFVNISLGIGLGYYYGLLPANKSSDAAVARNKIDMAGTDDIRPSFKSMVAQEKAVVATVKKVSPAVVSIIATKELSAYGSPFAGDPLFEQFFGQMYGQNGTQPQEIGGGSGFIITKDGLILTNRHVVEDQTAEYTVLLNDERKLKAEVVAIDSNNDIALLRIKAKNLATVKLGDSDGIEIGQTVIAIGNALGEFRNTVSTGVVSGLARSIEAGSGFGSSEQLRGVIQTDAAINFGNSGGPLLNLGGEVIGMNTAVAQDAQNIGFAIPINDAKRDIESVKKFNRIVRPVLGIRFVQNNKIIASQNGLSVDYGAIVSRGASPDELAVKPGGPADKAGIVENDIILEINGIKIDEENPLPFLMQKFKVGDEVTLKVLHDGKEKIIKAVLTE